MDRANIYTRLNWHITRWSFTLSWLRIVRPSRHIHVGLVTLTMPVKGTFYYIYVCLYIKVYAIFDLRFTINWFKRLTGDHCVWLVAAEIASNHS